MQQVLPADEMMMLVQKFSVGYHRWDKLLDTMACFEYDYQINVAFNKKPVRFLIFTWNPRKLTYNRQTDIHPHARMFLSLQAVNRTVQQTAQKLQAATWRVLAGLITTS